MEERIKQDYRKYYDILEILGYGAYGVVYKGKEKKTYKYRAIKVIEYEKIIENLLYEYDSKQVKDQLQK